MDNFSEHIKSLTKDKRKALLSIIKEKGEEYNVFPLSSEQSRMWFIYSLEKNNPQYNVPFIIELNGEVDYDALEKTINCILKRNKALVTTILNIEGEAFQYINEDKKYFLNMIDISEEESNEKKYSDILEHERNKTFNLEEDIPIRMTLVKLGKQNYSLVVVVHHMFIDGWSMGVFYREFREIYTKYCECENPEINIPDIQYVNYAMEQNSSDDMEKEKEYWKEKMKNASVTLDLPYSFPVKNSDDNAGDIVSEVFDEKLKDKVEEFCHKNKITNYTFFLSIYYLTLRKCCRQNNITVGSPMLNRNSEKLSSIIGFFANTICLNVDIQNETNYEEFIKDVNNIVLEGIDNSRFQFDKLVDMLNIERDGNKNPIFQTVFSLHNNSLVGGDIDAYYKAGGLSSRMKTLEDVSTVQFDLICTVTQNVSDFQIDFAYKKNLFSKSRINEISRIYKNIAEAVLDDPCKFVYEYEKDFELKEERNEEFVNLENQIKDNADIYGCKIFFLKGKFVIYYLSSKEIDKNIFKDLLKDLKGDIISVRLKNYPIDSLGNIDYRYMRNKSYELLSSSIDFTDKMKKKIDVLDINLINKEENYYKIKDLIGDYRNSDIKNNIHNSTGEISKEVFSDKSYLAGEELEEFKFKTLQEVIMNVEDEYLDRKFITIQYGGKITEFTYKELLEDAEKTAENLKLNGLKKNDKVILEIRRLDEFIKVFWGCILAGATVIPLGVPQDDKFVREEALTERFINIFKITECPFVVAGDTEYEEIHNLNLNNGKEKLLRAKELFKETEEEFILDKADEKDIALILFTSGSTGMPKGVKLCHRNVIKRAQGTIIRNNLNNNEISLNWMPLDHVGGIVMFHILDTINRAQQIHVETNEILRNPLNWLIYLDRYKATLTWAPNFAYGLIIEHSKEISKLDISLDNLKFILNGGEAINYNACHEFLKILSPKNLVYEAMKPSWGMTETSSGVLFSNNFGKIIYKNSVSVGKPIPGVQVRIADENGNIVPKGEIGLLQVNGETINQGYYKNEEENRKTFTVDGWFDTGDYSKIINDEIVITGRAKDIIIINGINISGQELEKKLEEIDEIKTGSVACTAIKDEETNEDMLAVFYGESKEIDREYLKDRINYKLLNTFGFKYDYLIPVNEDDIPRTSIGKIEKKKLVSSYLNGKLHSISESKKNKIHDWFEEECIIRKNIFDMKDKASLNEIILIYDEIWEDRIRLIREKLDAESILYKEIIICDRNEIKQEKIYTSKDNFKWVFSKLESSHVNTIIYFRNSFEENLEKDEYIKKSAGEINIIKEITEESSKVFADEKLFVMIVTPSEDSINSLIKGYCASIPLEYENVSLKIVKTQMPDENFSWIINEIREEDNDYKSLSVVSYEDDKRYIEGIRKIDLLDKPIKSSSFIHNGTYVILGGLGGIGILLSEYLMKNYKCRLIIIGKTDIDRNEYKNTIYKDLKRNGDVEYYSSLNENDFKMILQKVYDDNNGNINGIINLIGEDKSSVHWNHIDRYLIKNQNEETIEKSLRNRMGIFIDINNFLKDKNNIELIMFSSATGFFGGKSFSIYGAVSRYIYDFQQKNNKNIYRTIAWSKWDGIGMTEGESLEEKIITENSGYYLINRKTGICSLESVILRDCYKSIIGLNLNSHNLNKSVYIQENMNEFKTEIQYLSDKDEELNVSAGNIAIKKVNKKESSFNQAISETEEKLLTIWKDVLGNNDIGINDKFFDVGGNSLKSIPLITKINEEFNSDIVIVDLFKYSTIKELSRLLNEKDDDIVIFDI